VLSKNDAMKLEKEPITPESAEPVPVKATSNI